MVRKGTRETVQEVLDYQLNWPIKLRGLSIRLQDKSYKITQEVIKLYINGLISGDAAMEMIRLSGIPLSRYVNSRKYVIYEGSDEVVQEVEDAVIDEFEEVSDVEVIEEEYVGQGVIRRLMGDD